MSFFLSPSDHAAVSSSREELGGSVCDAWRRAGGAVPQAAVRLGAGLWDWPACHTLCPEDALCDLAAIRHHTAVSGQVCVLKKKRLLSCEHQTELSISDPNAVVAGFTSSSLAAGYFWESDSENCRIKCAYFFTALRRTLLRPMQRLCCHLSTWTPVNRGRNGQIFLAAPAMLLLPLTCCSTAPLKQHRWACLSENSCLSVSHH